MKTVVLITRLLMALLYLFSASVMFFKLVPQPELTGNIKLFMEGVAASGYLMIAVKAVELLCSVAFISGRFVPLATVVIFPINVNILLVHLFLAPDGLAVAIFLILGNLLLAYYHREKYKPLLAIK
ncbi:MAG TPA: hypothetical protein PK167_10075 [Prolixibacteraceae bacterium]|nr:hypothetical protein [Prolixibacteraceae bacterium]